MTKPDDVSWACYKLHEGPFLRGVCPFVLPDHPTREERIIAVITAVESGHYDAVNCYDAGILSSGLVQWIEAGQYSVSAMLGEVYKERGSEAVLQVLKPALDLAGATFLPNGSGRFRFFFKGHDGSPQDEVDTIDKQRMLFTGGSDEKGTWTERTKLLAKTWAACIATLWQDPENQAIQRSYTASQLSKFVRPAAHQVFLTMNMAGTDSKILEAAYAAYLSFAVNNPVRAEKHLNIADDESGEVYDEAWLNVMLSELTYGPNIAIYPARYRAIKPVLEELYGVKLLDLKEPEWAVTVESTQQILMRLGFDLGPYGADGKFGPKTKDALVAFQRAEGLSQYADGTLNGPTVAALRKLA
jgi:hypothetical protein